MTETQRQPVPRTDSGEIDTALAFLRFARASVANALMLLRDTPAVSAICGRTSSYWRVETPRNRAPIMRSAVALFS